MFHVRSSYKWLKRGFYPLRVLYRLNVVSTEATIAFTWIRPVVSNHLLRQLGSGDPRPSFSFCDRVPNVAVVGIWFAHEISLDDGP